MPKRLRDQPAYPTTNSGETAGLTKFEQTVITISSAMLSSFKSVSSDDHFLLEIRRTRNARFAIMQAEDIWSGLEKRLKRANEQFPEGPIE